jgi:hypothetical protein
VGEHNSGQSKSDKEIGGAVAGVEKESVHGFCSLNLSRPHISTFQIDLEWGEQPRHRSAEVYFSYLEQWSQYHL